MDYRKFAVLAAAVFSLEAAEAVYQLDPARSSATLSGTVAGSTIEEQAPGSLTTQFEGAIHAELGTASIEFLPSTVLDAQVSGEWAPSPSGSGTAPADFGAQAFTPIGLTRGALRDIILTLTSDPIPLEDGSFSAEPLRFSFPPEAPSTLDYNAGFLGTGSEPLAGNATNFTATAGSITRADGVETLTLSVDTTFTLTLMSENDSTLRFRGQLTATRPIGPIFRAIEIVDNQVRLTVDQTEPGLVLQSSSNLDAWTDLSPEITEIDADTRLYVIPAEPGNRFFRLAPPEQP